MNELSSYVEIPVRVAYRVHPEIKGTRENGLQLEPDEPAEVEILGVYCDVDGLFRFRNGVVSIDFSKLSNHDKEALHRQCEEEPITP